MPILVHDTILQFLSPYRKRSQKLKRRKLSEQDVIRLMKEKEHFESVIESLKKEIEVMNRTHEQQIETKCKTN
jgi:hypothetical protein